MRIPAGRRQTSWLFTKRGEFALGITEDKFNPVVRLGDLNPGLPHLNPQLRTMSHAAYCDGYGDDGYPDYVDVDGGG